MEGVVNVSASIEQLPNEMIVQFRLSTVALRDLIDRIHDLGYKSAVYAPEKEKDDIRQTLEREVKKYKTKFTASFFVLLPILFLIWIVPPLLPEFITWFKIWNGMPLYIWLILGYSTFIQFVMGADFYKGAYKSLRHGTANMDVLVVLGTSSAWIYGVILILVGDHESSMTPYENYEDHVKQQILEHAHNFEISSYLITVILLGKFMESYSKK